MGATSTTMWRFEDDGTGTLASWGELHARLRSARDSP